ncbi:MAG: serine hydrolase domain-containing protein [Antricoccus sp.]
MDAGGLIASWPVTHASAVVLADDGRVVAEYGDQNRVYRLASVTKLIAAYAALIAIEEGVFELDDPAGPDGSTIRHLLAHASGLDFESPKVVAAPGHRRIYSSPGFAALAEEMAQKSGIPFAEYARQAVLEPLQMTATTISGATGKLDDGADSSCADLKKFAAELLNPTLVSRQTVDAATVPVFAGLDGVLPGFGRQTPNPWGLGFEIRGAKSPHWTGTRNSTQTFGHFGQTGTFLWVDRQAQKACIALTDHDFGPWAVEAWPSFSDAVIDL